MSTFDKLQTLLKNSLCELQQVQKRGWLVLPMTRTVKEEELGRCCYLAEEFLSPEDLYLLKREIGLDERQWRRYKVCVCGQ